MAFYANPKKFDRRNFAFLAGDVHTKKKSGDVEVRPAGALAKLPPAKHGWWCIPRREDFEGCQTVSECQSVIDEACREAGTDTDPNWASYGPVVFFEPVNEVELALYLM